MVETSKTERDVTVCNTFTCYSNCESTYEIVSGAGNSSWFCLDARLELSLYIEIVCYRPVSKTASLDTYITNLPTPW